MFAMRPSIPYFGYQRPGMPQMAPQVQQAPQMGMPQMPPQMPPQVAPQQGAAPMQPGQQGMMQLSPQLLAQLAQLRGMGLGGMGGPQQPMFGRPGIQPITSGAYSLR